MTAGIADDPTVALAAELIARRSVTPDDAGCQAILGARLEALGFRLEPMRFGEVDNLWARLGADAPLLALAGHTDVVPPGPEDAWRTPPFEPVLDDGWLRGRGAADMKGSLAAMVTACEAFVAAGGPRRGSIGFLLTSDEEGPSVDGTRRVVEALAARGERIDLCVVGEPSSTERVGDVVKHGRRGSLGGRLVVHGVQGHVAYPHQVVNPIHGLARALAALADEVWDEGSADFPPTSFQVSNAAAGTGATNVVPATAEARFNLRYSTAHTADSLKARIGEMLDGLGTRLGRDRTIEWEHSGEPFLTRGGELVEAVGAAIADVAGERPRLSTEGGTSDARFIAPTGAEVIELGPVNATIHQVDERVRAEDLARLSRIYLRVLERLVG